MRTPAEYRRKGAEFDQLAQATAQDELKSLYQQLANEYRDLAAAVETVTRKKRYPALNSQTCAPDGRR
jgi:hypothetical protein